jgi:glycosyltransferase involved in cell wall biosynthesis
MAVGKPIIMGVQGNAADIVNEAKCGIIVEPENANSLAEAAESLFIMSPEDLKSMGDNSRTYYDKNLSVKSGIDKFIKIFDNLI